MPSAFSFLNAQQIHETVAIFYEETAQMIKSAISDENQKIASCFIASIQTNGENCFNWFNLILTIWNIFCEGALAPSKLTTFSCDPKWIIFNSPTRDSRTAASAVKRTIFTATVVTGSSDFNPVASAYLTTRPKVPDPNSFPVRNQHLLIHHSISIIDAFTLLYYNQWYRVGSGKMWRHWWHRRFHGQKSTWIHHPKANNSV